MACDHIGNQAVAVFADQLDFFFGTGDGVVQRLAFVADPPADGFLFFDGRDGERNRHELFARQVRDADAVHDGIETATLAIGEKLVKQEFRQHHRLGRNPMHRVLDVALRQFIVPHAGPTNFSAFADQQVTLADAELRHLSFGYPHFLYVAHIGLNPLHIRGAQVGLEIPIASLGFRGQHLAQDHVGHVLQPLHFPVLRYLTQPFDAGRLQSHR